MFESNNIKPKSEEHRQINYTPSQYFLKLGSLCLRTGVERGKEGV